MAEATGPGDLGRALLHAAGEAPWLPGMANRLARGKWEVLGARPGVSPQTYSTSRVLAGSAFAPRRAVGEIGLAPAFGCVPPVFLERLDQCDAYCAIGMELSDLRDAEKAALSAGRLSAAFDVIAEVPSLAAAVGGVLRVVHVLHAPSPDHDVSYSDPAVPFSAFVGVPEVTGMVASLRLAEGLVHEAMHLQLTLLEAAFPLVVGEAERHWSPWQATLRPTQGVLHGFYVFTVLGAMFATLSGADGGLPGNACHLAARQKAIRAETACALASLSASRELTPFGRSFLDALRSRPDAARTLLRQAGTTPGRPEGPPHTAVDGPAGP